MKVVALMLRCRIDAPIGGGAGWCVLCRCACHGREEECREEEREKGAGRWFACSVVLEPKEGEGHSVLLIGVAM